MNRQWVGLYAVILAFPTLLVVGAEQVSFSPAKAIDRAPVTVKITEDDPRWNCLTMGNHRCGPAYRMVDELPNRQTWVTAINQEHPGYDPYRCLVRIGDTSTIVCQDGWTESS